MALPAWLILLLNFLMSDLFDQLVKWAKEIIESLMGRSELSSNQKREAAVAMLRAQADAKGHKVSRWMAGQAVEMAFADLYPERAAQGSAAPGEQAGGQGGPEGAPHYGVP